MKERMSTMTVRSAYASQRNLNTHRSTARSIEDGSLPATSYPKPAPGFPPLNPERQIKE